MNIEDEVSTCPYCAKGIKPTVIKDFDYAPGLTNEQSKRFAIMQCPVCKKYFFVDQVIINDYYGNFAQIATYEIYPKTTSIEINFDNRLKDLISSDFCMIYNQALIADNNGLTV